MTSPLPIPENPYVALNNDILTINCDKKKLQFRTSDISKIYLKKSSHYWHILVGHVLSAPSNIYDLHIETTDGHGVCLTVNTLERFYFIRLIAQLREAKGQFATKKARPQQYFIRVA